MTDHFASYEDKEKAFSEVNSYYSFALTFYSNQLNKIHHIKKPTAYWEVILGRWLREICLIYIDRLTNFNKSSEAEIRLYREYLQNNPSIPNDYNDFYRNHQSTAVEANLLHSKQTQSEQELFFLTRIIKIKQLKNISTTKEFLIYLLKVCFNQLSLITYTSSYIFSTDNFSTLDKLKVYFKSKGKIFFYVDPLFTSSEEIEINLNARFTLLKEIFEYGYQSKDKELLSFLLKSMPKSYVENFNYLKSLNNLNSFNKKPKEIYLDSRFRNDDCFNIQLAEWVVKGTRTKVLQHDLNSFLDFDSLFQCDSIFDEYLSWGDQKLPPPLRINSFASKYRKFKNQNLVHENDLFVCRSIPNKQTVSLAYTISHAASMVEGRKSLSDLSDELEKQIFIRFRSGNLLSKNTDDIHFKESNKLKYANREENILHLFSSSRIIVFEGFSTGVFQCLSINKPFLIFLNKDYLDIRSIRFKDLSMT